MGNHATSLPLQLIGFALGCALLAGCASNNPIDPRDPMEGFNRGIYKFNTAIDDYALRPVAKVYDWVFPSFVKKGVRNVFNNLDQIPTVANDVLQLDPKNVFLDTSRFAINIILGVGGLFDVASHFGLARHHQDFGLTLAHWGYTDSTYLMLPFLGPSTIRDTVGLPVDYYTSIYPYINPERDRYAIRAIDIVSKRAELLPADKLLKSSFDPYVFLRNAYYQRHKEKLLRGPAPEIEDHYAPPFEDDTIKKQKKTATTTSLKTNPNPKSNPKKMKIKKTHPIKHARKHGHLHYRVHNHTQLVAPLLIRKLT